MTTPVVITRPTPTPIVIKRVGAAPVTVLAYSGSAPGRGVPAGGTTGQVLAKASDADFDGAWVDETGGVGGGVAQSYVDNAVATELAARNLAITTAINNLVNTAPGTLDTLKELADALGDDPNFAATITAALAAKAAWRGAWQATTAYAVNDMVSNGGGLYLATTAFTSGSSFNPANWTKLVRTDADLASTYAPVAAGVTSLGWVNAGDPRWGLVLDWNGTTGTDNSTAFQALVTASVGKIIWTPPGVYLGSTTIDCPAGTTIVGNAMKKAQATDSSLIWNGLSDGLRFIGSGASYPARVEGLSLQQLNTGNTGCAIVEWRSWRVDVSRCNFGAPGTGSTIKNNNWKIGIHLHGGLHQEIDHCSISLGGPSVAAVWTSLAGTDDISLRGSTFQVLGGPSVVNCTTSGSSTTVNTTASTSAVKVGMAVAASSAAVPGGLVPAGTIVTAVTSTTITLSNPVTLSTPQTLWFQRIANLVIDGTACMRIADCDGSLGSAGVPYSRITNAHGLTMHGNDFEGTIGHLVSTTASSLASRTSTGTATNGLAVVLDANAQATDFGMNVTGTGFTSSATVASVVPGVSYTVSENYTGTTGAVTFALAFGSTGGTSSTILAEGNTELVGFSVGGVAGANPPVLEELVTICNGTNTGQAFPMFVGLDRVQNFVSILDKPPKASTLTDGTRAFGGQHVIPVATASAMEVPGLLVDGIPGLGALSASTFIGRLDGGPPTAAAFTVANCTTSGISAVISSGNSFAGSGVVAGMGVTGSGISAGTTVVSVDTVNNRITLSSTANLTSNTTLSFYNAQSKGWWSLDATTPAIWVCTAGGTPGTWTAGSASPTGAAGGDLTGTYPNPTLAVARAPLASPAFTGTPTAPTPTAGDNTTKIATTAFTSTAIANLVNSAPSTLDTLGEIATQLASDESAATALVTTVGGKVPSSTLSAKGSLLGASAAATPVDVPVGADGTEMVADSTQTSGVAWKQRTRSVSDTHTDLSVVNSTTETVLASQAIPTTVAAGDILRMVVVGDLFNNTGSTQTYTFKVILGATAAVTSNALGIGTSGAARSTWRATIDLLIVSTTADQRLSVEWVGSNGNGWAIATTGRTGAGRGTAAENLPAGKNLQLSVTLGAANTLLDCYAHESFLEVLKR